MVSNTDVMCQYLSLAL